MKRSRKFWVGILILSLMWIIFSFFHITTAAAESGIHDDTVLFEGVRYYMEDSTHMLKLKVPIVFSHDDGLVSIIAPFIWSGPTVLDSVSFAGSRIQQINEKYVNVTIDSLNKQVLLGIVCYYDTIPSGRGLLSTLHFTVADTGYLEIDTSFFPPSNVLAFSGVYAIGWTPEFIKLQMRLLDPNQDIVYLEPAPTSRVSADGDTFYIQPEGEDFKVDVNLKNETSIAGFECPLMDKYYAHDRIFLELVKNNGSTHPKCFVGSRVEQWGVKAINLDLYPPQFLLMSTAMMSPYLQPGDGPMVTLTFTAIDSATICLDTCWLPGPGIILTLVDTLATGYTPGFVKGIFHVQFCPYRPGDLNWDGLVDILDLPLLVYYLFKEWEKPCPLKSADANCDQEVTIADAVYLVNYIFRSGASPQNCDY